MNESGPGRSVFELASITFLLWINVFYVSSQEYDFGIWSETGIVKKTEKWQFSSLYELRTRESSQQSDRMALIVSPRYSVTDWLIAGLAYMPMLKWEEDYTEWRHRHYYFLQGSLKYRDLTFSLRERLQFTHRPASSEDNSWLLDRVWRNQLKASKVLTTKPLILSVWIETFTPLHEGFQFEEYRYALSCTWFIKNKYAVEGYLLLYDKVITDIFYVGINTYLYL